MIDDFAGDAGVVVAEPPPPLLPPTVRPQLPPNTVASRYGNVTVNPPPAETIDYAGFNRYMAEQASAGGDMKKAEADVAVAMRYLGMRGMDQDIQSGMPAAQAAAKHLPALTWGATKEIPGYIRALHAANPAALGQPTVTTTNGVKILTDPRGRSSVVKPEPGPIPDARSRTLADGTKIVEYGKGQMRFVPPPQESLGVTNIGGVNVLQGKGHIIPRSAMPQGTNTMGDVQTHQVLDKDGKPIPEFIATPSASGNGPIVHRMPSNKNPTLRPKEELSRVTAQLKEVEKDVVAAESDIQEARSAVRGANKGMFPSKEGITKAQAELDAATARHATILQKRDALRATRDKIGAPAAAPSTNSAPVNSSLVVPPAAGSVPVKVPMDRPAKKEEMVVGGLYKTHLGPRYWDGGYFVTNAPAIKQ